AFRSWIQFLQELLQGVDALRPKCSILSDPVDEGTEPPSVSPVVGPSPVATGAHEGGATESGEVLGDGRLRNLEVRRQLLHAPLALGEALENRPPARIGKGTKDLVL